MSSTLSIVMYHYVRDLQRSRFPSIKGLDVAFFREQLEYFRSHYAIVSMEDVLAAIEGSGDLPPGALLLTFDDGYIDHYDEVFPILKKAGLSGSFFPPAQAVSEGVVLDVNKIHFVLASVSDTERLLDEVLTIMEEFRESHDLPDRQACESFAGQSRYDPREVEILKRLLQVELPPAVRKEIIKRLFIRYVTTDEESFARELYVSEEHLREMLSSGMFIGSHGYAHTWLDHLDAPQQEEEVQRSLDFLGRVGCRLDRWVMCYPYGAYNDELLRLLDERDCAAGLTTDVGIADLGRSSPLVLPRLDTNDFPRSRDAVPNGWTLGHNGSG